MREKKLRRAVAILTQIIRNDPTNASAYLNRGSAQAMLGALSFALNDYSTALRPVQGIFCGYFQTPLGRHPTAIFLTNALPWQRC